MTEENKVPQESQPVPLPEAKEEELIEIPFDYRAFQPLMEYAIRTINNVKTTIEGYAAYAKCAGEMADLHDNLKRIQAEIKQLHELDAALASTKFTNKESVNAKIRKRVVEELTKHFKFTKIDDEVANADDLVVFDVRSTNSPHPVIGQSVAPRSFVEQSTQPVVEKPENLSVSRDLTSAANQEKLRREARAEAFQERGQNPAKFYEAAFNQDNAPVNMEVSEAVDTEGLTPDEIAQFQGAAAAASDPRAEALKAKVLPKKLSSGPVAQQGKNRSITRR